MSRPRGYASWNPRRENENSAKTRVALTADQVDEHDLPTAPPKASDTRSVSWVGETCQLEAMPPDLLADTVREAIEEHLDLALLETTQDEERAERRELRDELTRLLEGGDR